jgi:hypothetical protein
MTLTTIIVNGTILTFDPVALVDAYFPTLLFNPDTDYRHNESCGTACIIFWVLFSVLIVSCIGAGITACCLDWRKQKYKQVKGSRG